MNSYEVEFYAVFKRAIIDPCIRWEQKYRQTLLTPLAFKVLRRLLFLRLRYFRWHLLRLGLTTGLLLKFKILLLSSRPKSKSPTESASEALLLSTSSLSSKRSPNSLKALAKSDMEDIWLAKSPSLTVRTKIQFTDISSGHYPTFSIG